MRGQYLADQTFLRGRQTTDAAGIVEFHTICPGWNPGRTVHIRLMVHIGPSTLTSRLHAPDDLNRHVLSQAPYAERPGRDTTNDTVEIFATGGQPAVLEVAPDGDGYLAAIGVALPAAEGTPSGRVTATDTNGLGSTRSHGCCRRPGRRGQSTAIRTQQ